MLSPLFVILILTSCSLGPPCSLTLAAAVADDGAESLPHFKWGQTREKLFVTVAVKGLERGSVKVDFTEDRLRFHGLDSSNKAFALDLELAQDIEAKAGRWEHLQRPDRWGDAVLATLLKKFPGRWDTLVEDSSSYRKVMDRDWMREDQKLEPLEDDTYLTEHRKYAPLLTATGLEKARGGVEALVINVRHKECDQCTLADDTFAKVAKQLAGGNALLWRTRVRLVIVDARRERRLARSLGAFCSTTPQECRHFVLGHGGGDEPVRMRTRHEAVPLLSDLERLSREQFRPTSASVIHAGRVNASRALIVLGPSSAPEARKAAHRLRLQTDVVISEEPKSSAISIWPPGEGKPDLYDEGTGQVEQWLRARSVAPLADTSEFEEDEPYEELGLPVARLFLNGDPADSVARVVVHDLAREFVGRVVFLARNATSKAHEWRQHGLPPGRFPSFAIAESMIHNATRYAFLDVPKRSPHTETTDVTFWSGPAKDLLRSFLESVLAQQRDPSFPSEAPPDQEMNSGMVRRLVGRTCQAAVESSINDTLIEVYDEWRRDHQNRTMHLDILAPILARWNITTYRLDLGYNECPPDVLPIISAGYSGYFFVHRLGKERKLRPERMKKLDPSFAAVLKFMGKHSEANFSKSIQAIQQELEASVGHAEQQDYVQSLWEQWITGSDHKYLIAALVGLAGLIAFFRLRWSKVPSAFGPPTPPVKQRVESEVAGIAVS